MELVKGTEFEKFFELNHNGVPIVLGFLTTTLVANMDNVEYGLEWWNEVVE